jgi:hypothetical protein
LSFAAPAATIHAQAKVVWRDAVNISWDPKAAARYGQFVAAAYDMYAVNNNDLRPAPKNIPAGWELSAWINMSDFFLQISDPKFYGIVAHEIANPDNRIIAIRGTEGIVEWLDDAASIVMVEFKQFPSAGRVAFGFDKIYSTIKVVPVPHTPPEEAAAAAEPELTGSFGDQLEQLAIRRETERGVLREFAAGRTRRDRPTVVTGHSLGSALATLFVLENSAKKKFDITTISTLASPKVGNHEFKHVFSGLPPTSWRIVNIRDVVPKLPPTIPIILDYEHVDVAYSFDSGDFAKKNLGCYHNIYTYLHWLDENLPVATDCA